MEKQERLMTLRPFPDDEHRNRRLRRVFITVAITVALVGASLLAILYPPAWGQAQLPTTLPADDEVTRLAVIGDFGMNNWAEADVAVLVAGWQPDAVLTVGDNNYPDGRAETIDANIGKHYAAFIHPYRGAYGPGAATNRFFPALGNHDWRTTAGSPPLPQPLLDYFDLPGNERYYDVVLGAVHIFVLDSDPHEPDGIESTSAQADWLRRGLAGSTAAWRIVTMHHPPYSSSLDHGSTPTLQWPYAAWGATAVLAGHDHTYERIVRDGIVYFVNGIGGAALYPIGAPIAGSEAHFNTDYGALLIEATTTTITYTLAARTGVIYDSYVQHAADYPLPDAPLLVGIDTRVAASADDAEEFVGTHKVNLTSTDLEFTVDPGDPEDTQLVGTRFAGVNLPRGVTIARAYIEFVVDEATGDSTSLSFTAEASDAPAPFQAVNHNLSQRVRTTARVTWDDVPDWPTIGRRWRTPDLAPIVQELVNRPGWQTGQAMVFLVEGSGQRIAASFDGSPENAPRLHIEIAFPKSLFLPVLQHP
jgi:tartrate-resistant acid phosphatase type 5